MSQTAGDVMVERLIDWGVDTVFGLPGDGINGVMEALRKRQDKIKFIQVRHEESAAFMACGHAKYTGNLGVCLATSGPGGIHLLNGLYDAKMDGQPVLAITGMHYHDLLSTHSQQDVDLDKLFMDVAVYNARVMGPAHVEAVTDIACRKALGMRGVSHITIPVDFQSMEVKRKRASERNTANHTSKIKTKFYPIPDKEELEQAAQVLNAGKKVAIMVGQGALGAREEVLKAAETLGAPVIKALLGKAVIPDDSPYNTGSIGLLGTKPSEEALEECDTLLMIGTSFPYLEYYPKPGDARGVQIDIDPSRIGIRYPVEVGLVGDSRNTLLNLLPLLERKEDRSFLEGKQKEMEKWNAMIKERGEVEDIPMKPQVLAWELGKRLADNAIISCDSGTAATWFAREIPAKAEQKFSLSGTLATMAPGLPYTIAAQLAYPDRQCVAFVGDGGLSMLMAELVTCVRYNLPVKVVVIKNNSLGQIKWEQMVMLGNPEFGCELTPIDFKMVAEACGVKGFTVEDPKECGNVLDEAFNHDGPALVEAVVDPNEAPLPAKITLKQAEKFAESILRGTPNRGAIVKEVAKTKIREMI